jgi:hypothetical protein
VVQAQEEGALPSFGPLQIRRVRMLRYSVTVQIEQAVGAGNVELRPAQQPRVIVQTSLTFERT